MTSVLVPQDLSRLSIPDLYSLAREVDDHAERGRLLDEIEARHWSALRDVGILHSALERAEG